MTVASVVLFVAMAAGLVLAAAAARKAGRPVEIRLWVASAVSLTVGVVLLTILGEYYGAAMAAVPAAVMAGMALYVHRLSKGVER